ncbi:MAG: hypothetical protein WAM70_02445 [Pyrinomonadaceae bacterium]
MLIAVFAVGFDFRPAAGQTKDYGRDLEVPAGYDLLKTVEGSTRFRFGEEFTIPADFFDKGSRPFSGVVRFKGVPLGSFRDQKTGDADTVVERQKAATFSRAGRSSVPIELAALSLESTRPISVQVGKEWQQWNVKLGLSPSAKSQGTMTISRRGEKGGTFDSEFVAYGLFTFTRTTDGAEKTLDVGSMKLEPKSIEKITLRTVRAPWSQGTTQTGANTAFRAGVTAAGVRVGFDESSRLANHGVIAALQ